MLSGSLPSFVQASTDVSYTLDNSSGSMLMQLNSGSLVVNADLSTATGWSNATLRLYNGAHIYFNSAQTLGDLELYGGSTASVALGSTTTLGNMLKLNGLAIDNISTLDLGDNAMILHYTPSQESAAKSLISGLLQTGYARGAWTGLGINSSAAANDPSNNTALGWFDQYEVGMVSVNGDSADLADGYEMVVKYTVNGDADLSGKIDATDSSQTSIGMYGGGSGWGFGDFNYDGYIDQTDNNIVQTNAKAKLALTNAQYTPALQVQALPFTAYSYTGWSGDIASFTDTLHSGAPASDYVATVDWNDGTVTDAQVTNDSSDSGLRVNVDLPSAPPNIVFTVHVAYDPNGPDHYIGAPTSASAVVTLNQLPPGAVASLNATYTLSGVAGAATLDLTAGSIAFNSDVAYQGSYWQNLNFTVAGSAHAYFNSPEDFNALTIQNNAIVSLSRGGGGTNGNRLNVQSLSIDPNATLDLADNALIDWYAIGGGAAARSQMQSWVQSGYANGAWTGHGIVSSLAADDTTSALGVGWMDNGYDYVDHSIDPSYTTFAGVNLQQKNQMLVRLAYYGDANLDGQVGDTDLYLWHYGYNNLGYTGWVYGDFNYDGQTDNTTDLNAWTANYGLSTTTGNFAPAFLPTGIVINPIEGVPFSGDLATFYDGLHPSNTDPSIYLARVNWGDGSFAMAQVTATASPGYFRINALSPALTDPNAVMTVTIQYADMNDPSPTYQGRPAAVSEPINLKPTIPTLSISPSSASEIDLFWHNTSPELSSIEIDRSTDGGNNWHAIKTLAPTSTTPYSDTGLLSGTQYWYRLNLTYQMGSRTESFYSNAPTTWTGILPPTGLEVDDVGASHVTLSWQAATGATHYPIFRRSSQDGTFTQVGRSSTTSYVDTNLLPQTQYYYEVGDDGPSGSASPNSQDQVSVTTLQAAPAPTNLSVTSVNDQVILRWQDNSTGITGYAIQRSNDGSSWFTLPPTGANATTYTDSSIVAGNYYYRIYAILGNDNSAATSAVPVTVYAVPTIANAAAANQSVVSGTTDALSVLGALSGGLETSLKYTWSATPSSSAMFSANGTNAAKNTTVTFTAAGTYDFSVTISNGTSSITSSATVLVTQTMTAIKLTPNNVALRPSATQQFTAEADDQFGRALIDAPGFSWSVPSGAGTVDQAGLFSASSDGGQATVEASAGGLSGRATVTVYAVPTIAAPAAASESPATGTTDTLSVLGALDGGSEASLTYTWEKTSGPWVNFSANDSNAAKNTTVTFTAAGTYDFTVTIANGISTITSSVTVTVDQTLTTIQLTPNTTALLPGATQQFTAKADDQFGARLTNSPSLSWSVPSGGGTVDQAGLYSASSQGGQATVEVSAGGVGAEAMVMVYAPPTVATPAAAAESPATGTTDALSVLGSLDGGSESSLSYMWSTISGPSASFSTNGSNGAKNTTVTFTAAGDYEFRVTISNGISSTTSSVSVTVKQTPSGISVAPNTVDVLPQATQQFSATAFDQFGDPMETEPAFQWSVSAGDGSVDDNGLFTAPVQAGQTTVQASAGDNQGYATVLVTKGLYKITITGRSYEPGYNATDTSGGLAVTNTDWILAPTPEDAVRQAVSGIVTLETWYDPTHPSRMFPDDLNRSDGYGFTILGSDNEGAANQMKWDDANKQFTGAIGLWDGDTHAPHDWDLYWNVTAKPLPPPDLSVDSSNQNGFDPNFPRSFSGDSNDKIQDSTSLPGKRIEVDNGDSDQDGIPDFADGFGSPQVPSSDADNAANSQGTQFTPVVLQLPPNIDLSQFPIQFTYSASDPLTDISVSADGTYSIVGDGKLRLWTKDGDASRDGRDIANGGDFVNSGVDYSASQLGIGSDYTVTLWAEAVAPSQTLADIRIQATLLKSQDGAQPTAVGSDAVRLSAFGTEWDQVDPATGAISPADGNALSDPSPVISISNFTVDNLHFTSDNMGIVGDLHFTGSIDDAASDLIEGAQGTIQTLNVFGGGSDTPLGTISIVVSKSQGSDSLLKPYDFSGTFDGTLANIALQPGWNAFTLEAVNAYGFTGTADISANVNVQAPPDDNINVQLQFSDDPYLDSTNDVTITATFTDNGGAPSTFVLTRSSSNPMVFTDVLGDTIVDLGPNQQIFHPDQVDQISAKVTNNQLGLVGEPIWVVETGNDTGVLTGTTQITEEDRPDYSHYILSLAGISDPIASGPGDLNAYLLKLTGPASLVSEVQTILGDPGSFPIGLGPNNSYYMDVSDGSRPAVLLNLPSPDSALPPLAGEKLAVGSVTDYAAGVVVGFTKGGVSTVTGLVSFLRSIPSGVSSVYHYLQNVGVRYVDGDTFQQEKTIASKSWKGIEAAGQIVYQINQNNAAVIEAIYTGDYAPLDDISPQLRLAVEATVELFHNLDDYITSLSDYEAGKLVGQVLFQIVSMVAGPELLALGKAGIIAKLSTLQFFQDGGVLAAAVAKTQVVGNKIAAGLALVGAAVNSPEARALERLMSLYEEARETLGPWAALQKVLALTAAKSSKFDAGLASFCDIVMPEIYQSALNADGTVAADWATKVPSYDTLKTASGGRIEASGVQKHHAAVQMWVKQMFADAGLPPLTQAELDSMPAVALRTKNHVGRDGTAAFHAILRDVMNQTPPNDVATILQNLKTAYDKWDLANGTTCGADYWKVAAQWLSDISDETIQ